jgi:N-acyl homoserine lactone hydrolase
VEKIRSIAERSEADVIFGHGAARLRSLPAASTGFYR